MRGLREKQEYSDRGLLQLICSTPDMPTLYVRNTDLAALTRMVDVHAEELWVPLPIDEEEAEPWYRALKTMMLLTDWTDELPDAKICERYGVGPGDIFGMVESVNWLLHATSELARMFSSAYHVKVREFEICMKNGIRRELLPLVKLRGIGRVRARRLFNNGIRSPDAVLNAGIEEVTRIIGRGIAEQIFTQLQGGRKKAVEPDDDLTAPGQVTFAKYR